MSARNVSLKETTDLNERQPVEALLGHCDFRKQLIGGNVRLARRHWPVLWKSGGITLHDSDDAFGLKNVEGELRGAYWNRLADVSELLQHTRNADWRVSSAFANRKFDGLANVISVFPHARHST